MNMIDCLMPLRKLHGFLYEKKEYNKLRRQFKRIFKEKPNTVFLVLTPEHSNIGDHAIALTETEFLNNLGISYIEITSDKLFEMKWQKKLSVLNGFPIVFNGGGYLGSLWKECESVLRDVMIANPKSVIIILPNTIYYDADEEGQKDFEKSKEIYNAHHKLYLYAREKRSFDLMKSAYNNVKLVPDIVLSRDFFKTSIVRKGCIICLRHDHERTRSDQEEITIINQAEELFPSNVILTDMIAEDRISISGRENVVKAKLAQFAHAELVITDRLHGMIFCAITGTPCIVINSKSPKVAGCYEWIKNLDYIRFAENAASIKDEYNKIPKGENIYDHSQLDPYFDELRNDLIRLIKHKK